MASKLQQIREAIAEGGTYNTIGKKVTVIMLPRPPKKREKRDWKTDTWRAYKRHYYHKKINKKFENCDQCQNEK